MRQRRRALTYQERSRNAQCLSRHLASGIFLRRLNRIAGYIANDGEMDLQPLISRLWDQGRKVYLPALHGRKLWFKSYHANTTFINNRFGIPEPSVAATERIDADALDLVLMPLVAFDSAGNRLGMGGGFYDQTFSFLQRRERWHRPLLIGVAHEFQRLDELPVQSWDIPMRGVVTERGLRWFD